MSPVSRKKIVRVVAVAVSLAIPCAAQEVVAPPEGLFSSVGAPAASAVAALPVHWMASAPGLTEIDPENAASRGALAPLLLALHQQGYDLATKPGKTEPAFIRAGQALTAADFANAVASAQRDVVGEERLLASQARDPKSSPALVKAAEERLFLLGGGHGLYLDEAGRGDAQAAWRTARRRLGPDAARLGRRMTAMAQELGRTRMEDVPRPGSPRERELPAAWRLWPSSRLRKGTLAAAVAPVAVGLTAGPLTFVRPERMTASHLGQAAYGLGNLLAFAFPLPQVYKTFRDGHARNYPVKRAALAIISSLLLGMINAPALGKALWGAQNLFAAAMLAAPIILGRFLERLPEGKFERGPAAGMTFLMSVLALSLAISGYVMASLVVPSLLSALLGAAAPALTLGILLATGAVYAALFIPDTIKVMRGQIPRGFSSQVSLIYFLDSALFLAWSSTSLFRPGPNHAQYLVLAFFNVVGTFFSFLSWYFTRRHERAAAHLAVQAPPLTNQGSAAILTGKETPR